MPDTDQAVPSPAALGDVLLDARRAGFLGPGPIEPHLEHAAGFVDLARRQAVRSGAGAPLILDLGSGGGLPGLVIAMRWPATTLVLLDANERRAEFLQRAVRRCGLGERVTVVHQRAEVGGRDPEYRGTFDGVVVRSFGAPAVVAECGAPFLRQGGWLIVSEPPGASDENGHRDRWPADGVAQVGLEPGEFVREGFGYQVLHQREACPERFPRRNGVPAKQPLF
ncbi:MAG TPA: RsmG family class I SAM-dependent methyltransferase [Acidimicrobiales bacterium]|nr:RsmG family class I SAM-dependent methyltransferase [Acidimicrobiales bacterium]